MFFLIKRGELFIVSNILANKTPVLYGLKDLKQRPVTGFFYSAQLTKTKEPKKENYFLIEKILGHKMIRNKKYYLCKFLYYDDRFNEYVLESDISENFEDFV